MLDKWYDGAHRVGRAESNGALVARACGHRAAGLRSAAPRTTGTGPARSRPRVGHTYDRRLSGGWSHAGRSRTARAVARLQLLGQPAGRIGEQLLGTPAIWRPEIRILHHERPPTVCVRAAALCFSQHSPAAPPHGRSSEPRAHECSPLTAASRDATSRGAELHTR